MKITILSLILMSCFVFSLEKAYGQNLCTQNLKKAQTSYDEGRINEVPILVESCLIDGFTKEEKVIAYKLLTLTYLYLDQPSDADAALLHLLKLNQEYAVNYAVDPGEFINLYHTFRTKPVFLISGKLGGGLPNINITKRYSLLAVENETIKYSPSTSGHISLAFHYQLTPKFDINPELFISFKKFTITQEIKEDNNNEIIEVSNSQTWLEFPLLFTYNIKPGNKFNPYVMAGPSVMFLASANSEFERTSESVKATDPQFTRLHKMHRLNYSAVMAAGLKMKVGLWYFFPEIRYGIGLRNIVNPDKRYEVQNEFDNLLQWKHRFIDSDINMNYLSVSIGIIYPIFIPKKLVK